MERREMDYLKGFIPYAVATAVLSLCGGLTAAFPPNVVVDWSLQESTVTWLALSYSLGAAVAAPIMGKLADLFGKRTILILGLSLFTAGPLLAALTPTGWLIPLMGCRVLAGVGASAVAPVVLAYIMTTFPKEKVGKGFMIYMALSCGMVIFGPTVGGILLNKAGWRLVMCVCAALSAVTWVVCFFLAERTVKQTKDTLPFDYTGAALTVVFFSMLLSIPTFGQNNGWTAAPTVICLLIGAISLALLIAAERKAKDPILNGKFMVRKQFILPVVVLFLSQGLLQSCMTNIITFALVTTGDRTLSGIATSVMYIGMSIGTVLIGPLADRREPRTVAATALVFVAIGTALQLLFTVSTGLLLMCAAMFFIGLGLGGNGTIFLKVALSGLTPAEAGAGSGTYNVFRDLSTPFGVALFVPMFTSRLAAGTQSGREADVFFKAQAAVYALHNTAKIQVICVIAGIIVCLFLPKIYARTNPTENI